MITIQSKSNAVTSQQTAESVIQFYCKPRIEDEEGERQRIVETAAKLIKSDIRTLMFVTKFIQRPLKCPTLRKHGSLFQIFYKI